MFNKIFIHFLFIQFISSFDIDFDINRDYPKAIYQSDNSLRKEENLDLSSMMVLDGGNFSKYEYNEPKWRDEASGLFSLKKENTRKIIREFYSFNQSSRWPNNVIPYDVLPELANDTFLSFSVQNAIKHWESMTCIKFERFNEKKHSKTHKAKLQFNKVELGCYSEVGYPDFTYNPFNFIITKRIFLERNCLMGQVIHEIGHTIGFFHEHSRNDRDKYVDILWNNIAFPQFNSFNFELAGDRLEKDNLNIPYDVHSIMHYPANAFALNFRKTIQIKDPRLEFLLGNRDALSFYDSKMANIAYKCSSSCKKMRKACQNDGYLGPRCRCVCPQGLTGKYCENFISKTEKSVSLERVNLTCDFTFSLCSWTQEKFRDEIDFIQNKQKSFTAMFLQDIGILNDRNSKNNTYLYLDSYYVRYPHESAQLKSPLITISSETKLCLSFWYHMFGNPMVLTGELGVYLHEPHLNDNMTKIWSRAGRQDHNQTEWLQAQINLNVKSDFRIVIKAQRFANYLGDIGLDDIELNLGECPNPDDKPSEWSMWYTVSGCFMPCATEYYERRRYCQVGVGKDLCQGQDIEQGLCPNTECQNMTDFSSNFTSNFTEISISNFLNEKPVRLNEKVNLDPKLKKIEKCGDNISLELNETVQIISPSYPNKYPLEIECSYLIKSQNGTKIKIKVDYLSLESTNINTCPDSVEVRYFALGQPGLRLCGNYSKHNTNKTIEFLSESNSAMIIFRSDWIHNGNGFVIKASNVQDD